MTDHLIHSGVIVKAQGVLTILLAASVALATSCESPSRKVPAEAPEVAARSVPAPAAAPGQVASERPVFTDNYMIFPVKWGRAEDVAASLDLVLKSRYGPEARVVPHIPTNKLFIYIPPQGTAARSRTAIPPGAQRR